MLGGVLGSTWSEQQIVKYELTGKRHLQARAFSQELYDTTDLDGIVYHSRLRKKNCMAIYERAVRAGLSAQPVVQLERVAALIPALKKLKTNLI